MNDMWIRIDLPMNIFDASVPSTWCVLAQKFDALWIWSGFVLLSFLLSCCGGKSLTSHRGRFWREDGRNGKRPAKRKKPPIWRLLACESACMRLCKSERMHLLGVSRRFAPSQRFCSRVITSSVLYLRMCYACGCSILADALCLGHAVFAGLFCLWALCLQAFCACGCCVSRLSSARWIMRTLRWR